MTRLAPRPLPGGDDGGGPLPRPDPLAHLPVLILFPHNRCNCRCLMCDIWKERRTQEIGVDDVARWRAEWEAPGRRAGRPERRRGAHALGALRPLRAPARGGRRHHAPQLGPPPRAARGEDRRVRRRPRRQPGRSPRAARCDPERPSRVRPPRRRGSRGARRRTGRIDHARAAPSSAGTRCACARRSPRRGRSTSTGSASSRSTSLRPPSTVRRARARRRERRSRLAREELPLLAAELDALERDCASDLASGFVAESAAKLRTRLLAYFTAVAGEGLFPANRCNAPWVSAVVEADGTVRPCFFHAPVGNLHAAGSLGAVLDSPEARAFRDSLDVSTNPVCKRCVCSLALR